jgi:hypothetical protein
VPARFVAAEIGQALGEANELERAGSGGHGALTVLGSITKPPLFRGLAALAPQDEEVLGRLILRCEGEARASEDEVACYATVSTRKRQIRAITAGVAHSG